LIYCRCRFFTFLFFMPKISRIGPCEYNKSCSTFHQESNKIEFAFFRYFYSFLEILQKSAKSLKMYFCAGAPRTFQSLTNVPLDCTKLPEKTWGLAMPPLAMGAARLWLIPVSRRHSRPGKRLGSTRSSARRRGG
jgi:hypothetical protein